MKSEAAGCIAQKGIIDFEGVKILIFTPSKSVLLKHVFVTLTR